VNTKHQNWQDQELGRKSAVKQPDMELPSVLSLGDFRLRQPSSLIDDFTDPHFLNDFGRLIAVLNNFRRTHGFGRAISAPQIGIMKRFIAMNIGSNSSILVNPEITWYSKSTITLWDDCMSFPDKLVRVQRASSISVTFWDDKGGCHSWERLPVDVSELVQHEVDHLDGVLAVDRAIDSEAIIKRVDYERHKSHYDAMVKYAIE